MVPLWYYGAMLNVIDVFECVCHCGHRWISRDIPVRCAKCKSRKWNGAEVVKPEPVASPIVRPIEREEPRAIPIPVREVAIDDFEEPEQTDADHVEYCQDKANCKQCRRIAAVARR